MKKRKFLLLILCVSCASPVFAEESSKKTSTGQMKLSETPMRGAHCEGSEKLRSTDEKNVQHVPEKETSSTAMSGRS